MLTIVNANMANAIRSKTVQKGLDPRDFSLVAFGGAGPLHGAEVAAMLDVPEVVVPPHPGITSAAGLLTTDLKYDQIMTAFQVKGAVDVARINRDFSRLSRDLMAQYEAAGLRPERVEERRAGDLRYVGQGYELRVPFPAQALDEAGLDQVWQAFHALHEREYGHCFSDSPIEIVNIRITGVGRMPKIAAPPAPAGGSLAEARVKTARSVFRVRRRARRLRHGVLPARGAARWRRRSPAPRSSCRRTPPPSCRPAGRCASTRAPTSSCASAKRSEPWPRHPTAAPSTPSRPA